MQILVLIPFVLYFVIVIAIGFWASRFSSKGVSEFFIGGRKMNRFVVAVSAVVSGRSAWLLIGFTGQAYMSGLSAIWAVVGYIVVEFLLFRYYAPRLRTYTEKNNCITIPDFYAARFKDEKGYLRLLLIFIFIIFMVTYIAAQFAGGGKAFSSYFNIHPSTGLIITAVIVLLYTLLGGFMAVSISDVFQAFIMLLVLLGLPVITWFKLGGIEEVRLSMVDVQGSFFNPMALTTGALIGFLGIGLGSPGNPQILVRYMSIKDPKQFRWTAIVGTIWNIFLALGALAIGIMARAYYPFIESIQDKDPENAFMTLSQGVLPPFLVGIVLAALFAAIMSTADSQLLVAASSIVRDLYEKIIAKNKILTQIQLTFYSRVTIAVLVYIAVMLGILVKDIIFWFVLFAWAGLGASIGPTSILTLFWKRTTKQGVFAGLITGTVTVFVWKLVPFLNSLIYELIPAFFLATIATIVVSLISERIESKRDPIEKAGYKLLKTLPRDIRGEN